MTTTMKTQYHGTLTIAPVATGYVLVHSMDGEILMPPQTARDMVTYIDEARNAYAECPTDEAHLHIGEPDESLRIFLWIHEACELADALEAALKELDHWRKHGIR